MISTEKPSLLSRSLKILIPIIISVSLVVWIYTSLEDPKKVWEHMLSASIAPLLAMIPLSLLSHLIRAWRWRRFMGEPVSLFYSFSSIMIGYAVNDVLPRAGEVARIVNMNRLTKTPMAKLLSTLVAERLLDVVALLVCLGLALQLQGDLIGKHFPKMAASGPWIFLGVLLAVAGLFLAAFRPEFLKKTIGGLVGKIHKKAGAKVEELIMQGADGLFFLTKPSQILPVFLETLAIWLLYLACFILGLISFGLLDPIGYDGGFVTFSITTVGVSIPAIGAIGTYHELGKQTMMQFFALDEAVSVASITVIHFLLFYIVGGLGGVVTWVLQGWVRKKRQHGEEALE